MIFTPPLVNGGLKKCFGDPWAIYVWALSPPPLSAPPRFIFDRDYTGSPLPFVAGTKPAEFYPNQSLDHFASNEERTAHRWSQRYFEDTSLWGGPGFPVFLALGGDFGRLGELLGAPRPTFWQPGASRSILQALRVQPGMKNHFSHGDVGHAPGLTGYAFGLTGYAFGLTGYASGR